MADPPFYIVLQGKACLQAEITRLCKHLALLTPGSARRFRRYLDSPLFNVEPPLTRLYPILYRKSRSGTGGFLQGASLVRKVLAGPVDEHSEVTLRQLIRSLIDHLLTFMAVSHLLDDPRERSRVLVERLDGSPYPDLYDNALREWRDGIDALPLGLRSVRQRWLAEHAAYFTVSIDKERLADARPTDAFTTWSTLRNLLQAQYATERINRRVALRDNELTSTSAIHEPDRVGPLVKLYGLIRQMYGAELANSWTLYTRFRDELLTLYPRLDRYDAVYCYTLLDNYLGRYYQSVNRQLVRQEWTLWLPYMVDHLHFSKYATVERRFFNNQLQIACILQDLPLARSLRDSMADRLRPDIRERTLQVADIMLLFYGGKYDEVVGRLANLPQRQRFHRHADDEGLRLTSYRVRSALYLLLSDRDRTYDFPAALDNCRAFLSSREGRVNARNSASVRCFIRICSRIHRAKVDGSLTDRHRSLVEEVKRPEPLHARDWLLTLLSQFAPDAQGRRDRSIDN